MLSHSTTTLSSVFLLTLTLLSTTTTALPTTSASAIAIFTRDDTPISKRASSGLTIKMYTGRNCDGSLAAIGNAAYDTSYIGLATGGYKSIQWLGRPLLNSEQVNAYSLSSDGDRCGHYVELVPRNSGTGCHEMHVASFDCIRLIHP